MAGRFADGVWFVDLVPVTDPAMIAPAIAAALGLGERQGRSAEDTVLGWLAGRETLLVLDNCEHLLDGVAVLLERLLAGSPAAVGAGHQPGPAAGAVRVGVPGARAVASRRTTAARVTRWSCSSTRAAAGGSPLASR